MQIFLQQDKMAQYNKRFFIVFFSHHEIFVFFCRETDIHMALIISTIFHLKIMGKAPKGCIYVRFRPSKPFSETVKN